MMKPLPKEEIHYTQVNLRTTIKKNRKEKHLNYLQKHNELFSCLTIAKYQVPRTFLVYMFTV